MIRDILLMTPGPTTISKDVLEAMNAPLINPDIDPLFFDLYKETTNNLAHIMRTKNEVVILNGEGILGLEAACASLIEPKDRVLVLSNGIFGQGFGDFVTMYGGMAYYYTDDLRNPFDVEKLKTFLAKDHDFKVATLVHCETPSGFINPIDLLCPLLKSYGILTVVDAVSSVGGIPIETDEWSIDLLLGGSQKCLCAPSGLTFLSISDAAKACMADRKTPIISFYANLTIWNDWYKKQWFPYTQPVKHIYALKKATDKHMADKNIWQRHKTSARKVRTGLLSMGYELYPHSGWSDTVTTFLVPDSIDESSFRNTLEQKHRIMISGAFGFLEGKVLRIGHMGEQCREDLIDRTLEALEDLSPTHHAP